MLDNILSFNRKPKDIETVLLPHINMLFKVAYQYTGQYTDAEDLVQELLADMIDKQQQLFKAKNVKAWLMKCLYHKFVDTYHKTKHLSLVDSNDDPRIVSLSALQTEMDEQVLTAQVLNCMKSLSANHRAVVSLHDINGMTLREISDIMDKPIGTLKSDLHRARQQIKKFMKLQVDDLSTGHINERGIL